MGGYERNKDLKWVDDPYMESSDTLHFAANGDPLVTALEKSLRLYKILENLSAVLEQYEFNEDDRIRLRHVLRNTFSFDNDYECLEVEEAVIERLESKGRARFFEEK